jgi:hypothetical protein
MKPMPKTAFPLHRRLVQCVFALAVVQTVACTSTNPKTEAAQNPAAHAPLDAALPARAVFTAAPFHTWQHYRLPGKEATEFSFSQVNGREVVEASANASASMLRLPVRVEAADLRRIKFSWMVPELIAQADMALRQSDDSPVRVVLAFEGDRSRFSMKNAMLSELSLAITGEPLPYATLMYVWCNTRPAGSVIINARTDRIRKLVVQSGAKDLSHWLDYERNVRADFQQAFGEAPGALVGIGIMTDSDNTQTKTHAWYGPLNLVAEK